jgi:hypothetical protein
LCVESLLCLLEKHDDLIRTLTLDVVNFCFEPEAFDDNNEKIIEVFNNELVADVKHSKIVVLLTPYTDRNYTFK